MQLHNYFKAYSSRTSQWRKFYSVEKAEQYILMINLAGLAATLFKKNVLTPSQAYLSDYGTSAENKLKHRQMLEQLNCTSDKVDIFGFEGCWFSRSGMAIFGDEVVNVWEEFLNGLTAIEIVNKYKAIVLV